MINKRLESTRAWKIRLLVAVVFIMLCTLALLKNYEWGSAYSAVVGLPSRTRDAELYMQRARLYGWSGLALELIATAVILPFVFPKARIHSSTWAVIGRFAIAFLIALLGTGAIFGILVLVAEKFRLG